MDVIWSVFARAGLTKHVPLTARRSVEIWINGRLRLEPWSVGNPVPVSETARVEIAYVGFYIRFLFDYDEHIVRVLSISRDSHARPRPPGV